MKLHKDEDLVRVRGIGALVCRKNFEEVKYRGNSLSWNSLMSNRARCGKVRCLNGRSCRLFVENGIIFNYDYSDWKREEVVQGEANSKATIDLFYWNKLSQLHPTDVCNRTEAIYHPGREGFLLPVYNLRYLILPKEKEILRIQWNDKPIQETLHPFFYLMVLVYLTEAKDIKPTHTWISEKDLKGGSTFFRGPHRLEVEELINLFGKDPEAFLKTGKKLGGSELLYGDKGFALDVFPKVFLAYILWKGDAEFPPKISVLFDSTIESHLPLDIIWCMVAETSRRLAKHASR